MRTSVFAAVVWVILLVTGCFCGEVAAANAPGNTTLVVKLAGGLTPGQQAAVIARDGGTELSAIPVLRLHTVSVPDGDLSGVLQAYQSDPEVERVEVDKTRYAEAVPSDTDYGVQWGLTRIGWDGVYGAVAPAGSAIVALLDTGVDASHPDLAGVLVPGTSLIDGGNGLSDVNGHGTFLAGIVAAVTDNGLGIAGVAYQGVRVMPVSVLGGDGTGQDSDIIAGIVWAADHGADVILMGFSNPDYSQNLQEAIDYAWSKGAVLVAATGNAGVAIPTFPAGHRGVVGVCATDESDRIASNSNYGLDTFLAAPGTNIFTTSLGGTYTYIGGTSASSAIVAGVAGFMKAAEPSLANGVIIGRLAKSADAVGTPNDPQNQTLYGNGRVNLSKALAETSTDFIQPAGAGPVGNGGPYVGPYTAATFHLDDLYVGFQFGSLEAGTSGTAYYWARATGSGSNTSRTLSIANLPAGATFSPATINNSGYFVLSITTASSTPAGTFSNLSLRSGSVESNDFTLTITSNVQAPLTVTGLPAGASYGQTGIVAGTSGGSGGGAVSFSAGSSTGCTVNPSNGALSITSGTGTCTITATKAGDAGYPATTSAPVSLAITPATQFITFAQPADTSFGAAPFTADAGASSSLPVSFASLTAPVCTVSGSTVTLLAVGTCSIEASQPGNANFHAAPVVTRSFAVNPGALDHFALAPVASPQTAGTPFGVTITAQDAGNNTVTGFTGTVNLVTTAGSIVPNLTGAFANGSWSGSVLVTGAGAGKTLTVSDAVSGKAGTSNSFDVVAAAAAALSVDAPTSSLAGQPVTVTVTAKDAYNNVATGYLGTIHFTTSDSNAGIALPADFSFQASDNGSHAFTAAVTLATAGQQTVRATDAGSPGIFGISNSIAIGSAGAVQLLVTAEPTQTAGVPFDVTVAVKDAYGNLVTDYTGTLAFSGSDWHPGSTLPGAYSFSSSDGGTRTFSGQTVLLSAGIHTVSAADTAAASLSGTSGSIVLVAAAAAQVAVESAADGSGSILGAQSVTAGSSVTGYAIARDAFGNFVANQAAAAWSLAAKSDGVVDGDLVAAADGKSASFTGHQVGTATLRAASGALTGSDSGLITVTTGNLARFALSALTAQKVQTPFAVTITAQDAFYNTVNDFSGAVALTVSGGSSITPGGSANFSGGSWTGSVTLSGAGTGRVITATNSAGAQSGTSNAFDVEWLEQEPLSVTDLPASASYAAAGIVAAVSGGSGSGAVSFSAGSSTGCTVDSYNGAVTITSGSGSCGISATKASDADFLATTSAPVSIALAKATVPVVLTGLTQSYAGSALTPVAGTTPAGLAITWTGAPQSAAGSYPVTATIADPNYQGSASGSFLIEKAPATVTLGNLTRTYTGAALAPSASTTPAGLAVTWTGAPQSLAGDYPVTATIDDPNYQGSASGTFLIEKAPATVVLGNLTQRYTGSALTPAVSTTPAGLAVTWTGAPQSAAGSYPVTATIADPNYQGSASGSFLIEKAPATVVLGNLTQSYTGAALTPSAETMPAGLALVWSGAPASAAGSYPVTATVADPNYQGSASGSFLIEKAVAPVSLGNLSQSYTGGALAPSVSTTPAGLAVVLSNAPQSAAGSYPVTATVNDPNYKGSASASFAITPAAQVISFAQPGDTNFGAAPFALEASASSGLPVSLVSLSAPVCTVSGATLTIVGVGTCTIEARQAGNANFSAAPALSRSFAVAPGALDHFAFGALSGPQTAGTPFTITITAQDAGNHTVTGFSQALTLSTTAGSSTPGFTPALVDGSWSGSVMVTGAGTGKTLSVLDPASGKSGTSGSFDVNPGAVAAFSVSTPPGTTAGQPVSVTVTAKDLYNNVATGYLGTVRFASSDTHPQTVLPADYGFQPADQGSRVFTAETTLTTAGVQTLRATDSDAGAIFGISNSIAVSPAGAQKIYVTAEPVQTAGSAFDLTVTVKDTYQNIVTGYDGTLHFTSNDPNPEVVLPADYAFQAGDGGTHTFAGQTVLKSAGIRMVTAADAATPSVLGVSGSITLSAGSAARVAVESADDGSGALLAGQSIPAGSSVTGYAVTRDAFGNFVANAAADAWSLATKHDGADDGDLVAAADRRSATFSGHLVGSATLRAALGSLSTSDSGPITVTTGALARFSLSPVLSATSGTPFAMSITAQDAFYNTVHEFAGSVDLSVSGGSGIVPASSGSFTNGAWSGSVTVTGAGTARSIGVSRALAGERGWSNPFDVARAQVSISSWPSAGAIRYGEPLSAALLSGGAASVPGSFAFTAPGTLAQAGTAEQGVSFTPADAVNYQEVSGSVPVTVTPADQSISFTKPADTVCGAAPFTLGATASSSLPVSFSSLTPTVCSVTGASVSILGPGTCSIEAAQGGNGNFSAAPAVTQSFAVTGSLTPVPENLSVPAGSTSGLITVSWSGNAGTGASYTLEQSYNGGAWSQVYAGSSSSALLVLTADGGYAYRVKASKANLPDSAWATSATVCNVVRTCDPPKDLAVPASDSTGMIQLSWTASGTFGVSYLLQQSYNSGPWSQVYSGSNPSARVPVSANGSYSYQVKAVKANFADSAWVAGATASSVALACDAPAGLTVPASNSTGNIAVSWSASRVFGVSYLLEQNVNGGGWSQVYAGSATTANLALTAGGSYSYRVKAVKDTYADSAWTTGSGVCSVALACGAPGSLTVPAVNTTGTISVVWGASNVFGVTYLLEQSVNGGAWSQVYAGSLTQSVVAAAANGSYSFRVKAVKGNYADSPWVAGSTACSVALACGAPGSLTVPASNSTGSISVSWSASDVFGVTYLLEQSFNGGAWTQIYSGSASPANLSFAANGNYSFRVKAVKANYADSPWATTSVVCSVALSCDLPTNLVVPSSISNGLISLSWVGSSISGVTYALQQSLNNGAWSQVYSGNTTQTVVTVSSNGNYSYRVKAVKANFADSAFATGATVCTVVLACDAPATLSVPTSNSNGMISLSWSASSVFGANYVVQQSLNGGAWTQVYSGTGTSTLVTVSANGSYAYRVKATKANFADSPFATGATACTVVLACDAPASLSVPASNSNGMISLSWSASSVFGATYVVQHSLNGGAWTQVYSGTGTSAILTVSANGSYAYRVKASKASYADSAFVAGNQACSVTLACDAPASLSVPVSNSTGVIPLSWSASSVFGASYVVQQSLNGGAWTQVYAGTTASANLQVSANGSYSYRVKTLKTGYTDSAFTAGAAACSVTLSCDAPASITVPASNTTGVVAVKWAASSVFGVSYQLQQSVNGGAWSLVYSGSSTSANLVVTANGSYSYRVAAVKANFADSAFVTGATSCTVALACGAPASLSIPASLAIPVSGTGVISLSWGSSDIFGATYVVEQSVNGGAWSQAFSGNSTTAGVLVTSAGSYSYRVKAVKSGYADSPYRTAAAGCTVTKP